MYRVINYLITLFIFIIFDLTWLGLIAKNFYARQIGHLMANDIRWLSAIAFYIIYSFAILYFSILPSVAVNQTGKILISGALLGLVCYATYDLTNLATLKGWPVKMVIIDIIWGMFATGMTAWLSFIITKKIQLIK